MKRTRKVRWIVCLFWCLFVLTGCKQSADPVVLLEEIELEEERPQEEQEDDLQEITICVHVCGQVLCPGVYELEEGSRVYEAIQLAGGLTENALESYINQAEVLQDGQKLYVPSKEEVMQIMTEDMKDAAQQDGMININTAEKEELMTLTGIGEKRAEAILSYRQKNGKFSNVEELMQVEGIKQGTYDKIKDQIKVS